MDATENPFEGIETPEDLQAKIERNRANGWADLSLQQKAFASEYTVSYDHISAAEKTGYEKPSGLRLLRHPLVIAYIEDLQELNKINGIITKDFINAQYLILLDMAMGREEIKICLANGERVSAKVTKISEAVSILKQLSSSINYAVPINANNNVDGDVKLIMDIGTPPKEDEDNE